ncbi:reverse transcriptase [Artemisia annua]|uniref:Reverse transcriptase n=1 Tax=Artemisia annua TaxID=35608 RepID=A0A2U1MIR7_ARTAN|nr:reverse transcriptase [Artemisia annua]
MYWNTITKSKQNGGLGVGNLQTRNEALLCKWLWRYENEKEAHWRKLIDAKYGSNESSLSPSSPRKYFVSPLWKKISGLIHLQSSSGVVAKKGLMHCVGRGNKTKFWEDHWVEGHILKVSFPRIFTLAIHKSGPVCNFGFWEDGQWNWDVKFRRRLFDWEVDQYEAFSSLLNSMMLVASNDDKVVWSFESSGKFSSKSFCYEVENLNYHGNPLLSSIWKFKVPPKARLLCWQVLSGWNDSSKTVLPNEKCKKMYTSLLAVCHQEESAKREGWLPLNSASTSHCKEESAKREGWLPLNSASTLHCKDRYQATEPPFQENKHELTSVKDQQK